MTGQHTDPPSDEILARYFGGDCTSDERDAVERWAQGDVARRQWLASLAHAWAGSRSDEPDPAPADVDRFIAHLRRAIARPAAAASKGSSKGPTLPTHLRRWSRTVAPLLACAAAAAVVIAVRYLPRHPAQAAWREVSTRVGQRATITLDDGTRVILAPGSVLQTPVGARVRARNARDVYLTGEALFTVMHDSAHPFRVRTANAVITDIGTQFDVRAYAGDAAVRVAVADGQVGLEPVGAACWRPACVTPAYVPSPARLSRGDVATLVDTALAITHGVDVAALTAWTRGELRFVNTPLKDVLADLSRWYGAIISVDPGIRTDIPVTITVSDPAVTDALDALDAVLGLRFTRSGAAFVLHRATAGIPGTPGRPLKL